MTTTEEIIPDLKIMLSKETKYWNNPPDQITDVYGIYLYDANLHVHVCSMTPSYECWFLSNYWVSENYDDLTHEEIAEADDYILSAIVEKRVDYFNTRLSEEMEKSVDISNIPFDHTDTDTVRDRMDEIVQNLMESYVHEDIAYQILNK